MPGLTQTPSRRNVPLDFFRGLALLIIFVNHVPENELLLFTPSRFGLSDAAEIFVFLSGYAAAIAYGNSFRTAGFPLGCLRLFHRCGQIYTAHLGLFGLMAMICVLGNALLDARDYITHLNIRYFFDDTETALRELIALRYVPNYFDILPMYLVIMLWIPGVLAVSQLHRYLGIAFPVGVYLAMWSFDLEFAADPVGDRPWFFNPFGWQLIFFVGFGFGSGWFKCPSPRVSLIVLSLLVIALSLPLSPEPALRPTPFLQELHTSLRPWLEKTRCGPLRLVHFLALAYLAAVFIARRNHWLTGRLARGIVQMGQQSLPVFVVSMVLSYVGGMVFDQIGHGLWSIIAVNVGGIVVLLSWAATLAWIKSSPWKAVPGVPNGAGHALPSTSALHWRHSVNGVAAFGMVCLVSVAPLLLTARKPVQTAAPVVVLSDNRWTPEAPGVARGFGDAERAKR